MTDQQLDAMTSPGGIRAPRAGVVNPHFAVAAGILLIMAAGWGVVANELKLATERFPVPWPAGVEVNDGFYMTAMPDRMGPFEFVSADGELFLPKDGKPDGEGKVKAEEMALLSIGTNTDQNNLPLRRSNWLSIRTYRDTRRAERDPLRYWRLEVYYYTGGVNAVPHVPEICGPASGAYWLGTNSIPITVGNADSDQGGKTMLFQRALFERTNMGGEVTGQFVQYYTFNVNGLPKSDRNEVRWALGSLRVKHAFFAKVQFAPQPVYTLPNPVDADKAAGDFVKHFMPYILKTLPTVEDVARLDEGGNGKTGS